MYMQLSSIFKTNRSSDTEHTNIFHSSKLHKPSSFFTCFLLLFLSPTLSIDCLTLQPYPSLSPPHLSPVGLDFSQPSPLDRCHNSHIPFQSVDIFTFHYDFTMIRVSFAFNCFATASSIEYIHVWHAYRVYWLDIFICMCRMWHVDGIFDEFLMKANTYFAAKMTAYIVTYRGINRDTHTHTGRTCCIFGIFHKYLWCRAPHISHATHSTCRSCCLRLCRRRHLRLNPPMPAVINYALKSSTFQLDFDCVF